MRPFTLLATAIVAAAPSLQTRQTFAGNAIVVNQCDFPLHIWSVDETFFPADSDFQTIAPGTNWSEPLRIPAAGCNCGVSLKVSKGQTLAKPILQFEYSIAEAASQANMFTSYDVSFVDCSTAEPGVAAVDGYNVFTGTDCPSWAHGTKVLGSSPGCPAMNCPAGQFCPLDAYFEPEPKNLQGPQPVRQCPDGDLSSDIIFVACSDQQSSSDSPVNAAAVSKPSPPPAAPPSNNPPPPAPTTLSSVVKQDPVTTPAPAPPAPEMFEVVKQNVVEVVTTVVTTVFVDPQGNRLNADGSPFQARRFAA